MQKGRQSKCPPPCQNHGHPFAEKPPVKSRLLAPVPAKGAVVLQQAPDQKQPHSK
ncbi:hypothetical protein EVA_17389 [gut metagenome]|uniref:Uncharacterized protein n=1 Tax=gut metagenome TaxID=749906 RepID=J9G4R9_9ZZZZ